MPVDTGIDLTNQTHENNTSCVPDGLIKFNELGLTEPFTLSNGSVIILRNFTEAFTYDEHVAIDMVYGPGLGTDFVELKHPVGKHLTDVRNMHVILVPWRYRLRYVGTRDPSELLVTFNTYPYPQIDYTQLALS